MNIRAVRAAVGVAGFLVVLAVVVAADAVAHAATPTPRRASYPAGVESITPRVSTGDYWSITTALTISGGTTAGTDAALTATVSPSTILGSVSFFDNGSSTPIGTVSKATAGSYVLDLPSGFAVGSHSVVAKFTPKEKGYYPSSQSAALRFVTNPAQSGNPCTHPGSNCTDTQSIQATVPIGTLTITTPYDSTHPLDVGTLTLAPGASQFTNAATFHDIKVTDDRSGGPGWTACALSTDLTDGGTSSTSVIDAQNVGLTGLVVSNGVGFTGTVTTFDNPVPSTPVAAGAAGNAGLGGTTPHTIATATHSEGTVTIDGTLTLIAPTSTEAGLFKGTIVFTVG